MPSTTSSDQSRAERGPASPGLAALAAATPDSRDRYVDLLRGVAIAMVALGHWLVVVPSYTNGTFDGVNALGTVPLMRWLSWLFQVMPLFFMVGGYANARSWRSAQHRGDGSWAAWVRGRFNRLLRPTLVFLVTWVAVAVVARQLGVDPHLVHTLAWLVVVPLWFLAVYVVIVALAPLFLHLHERFGAAVLVGLAVPAIAVDALRMHAGMEGVAYVNFLCIFLFCQQLGFFWLDGRLTARRWQPAAMLAGGASALWLLTHVGPYPLSMVGVPGERIANNAPPTITFLALGVAQAGLVLAVRRPIDRWLHRPRVWASVIGVNAHAMTIHLWHFTALVVVALVVLPLGIVPTYPEATAAWWVSRWAAIPVLAGPLVGLVLVFGRVERRPAPTLRRPSCRWLDSATTALAVPVMAAAFAVITVQGLSVLDAPVGFPVVAAALMAGGLVLLRVGTTGAAPADGSTVIPVTGSVQLERAGEEVVLLGGVSAGHPGGG